MAQHPTTRRRVMRRFKLSEISAVDRPAQKGATMTIMKREEDHPTRETHPMEHEHDFYKIAADLRELDSSLSVTESFSKARRLAPGDFAKMRSQAPAAFDTREEAEAHINKMNFEMTIARIKKELGCSGTDA